MKILILDIETTGFQQQGGKIIEVGIVELDLTNGERKILFNEVCHEQGITLEEIQKSWIVQNSDITIELIKYSGTLESKRSRIQKILNDYPLGATAFNNSFDFGFLESRGFTFPIKLPCPMKLSTDICKIPSPKGYGFKWPKVEEAHLFFFGDVGYIEKHRGADDAYFESEIVYKLYQMDIFKLQQ